MTVSITPCWRKTRRILERVGRLVLVWLLWGLVAPALAGVELWYGGIRSSNNLSREVALAVLTGATVDAADVRHE